MQLTASIAALCAIFCALYILTVKIIYLLLTLVT